MSDCSTYNGVIGYTHLLVPQILNEYGNYTKISDNNVKERKGANATKVNE